ncbi:zinc-binding dehydrogenase [Pseudonocardia sp. ICBG1293]|uniref:zinc-binding dehydrogenase n=1 Tax=Pseudonocardia sp. ICBG1293 TaxID=2844382 RepID=UPI001CCAA8AB|nr:zinc-binding dehydrogenase [Pseudonocardia sp. ICBG1293]
MIRRACPDGVDVFFDSVGGATLDAALPNLDVGARIAVCGTIGLPPDAEAHGPRIERRILVNRVSMQGFLATDHLHRIDDVVEEPAGWLRAGRIRHREDISPSSADAPEALVRLSEGRNTGKSLVRVADIDP